MTAQAPLAQQQQDVAQDALEIAAVLAAAATVAAAMAGLGGLISRLRIRPAALQGALVIVYRMPPEAAGMIGPATRTAIAMNLMRRAQFTVAAARRLNADWQLAISQNRDPVAALAAGMAREQRYFALHVGAVWNRVQAAARTDSAAMTWGRLLGWHAVMDAATSRECRAANGRNYLADLMPLIGYPGSVHPRCRCWPGRPFPGARLLPSVRYAPPVPVLAAA